MQNFILIQFNFFILMNELIYIFEIVIRIINLTFNIKLFKNNRPLAKVVIASSSDLPVQRLS
ncbi:hypothetical protein BTH25_18350 [Acinetobacter baumannii]|nr:hypothetical protein BTH25_18350 [Acinetobacter baumannii]